MVPDTVIRPIRFHYPEKCKDERSVICIIYFRKLYDFVYSLLQPPARGARSESVRAAARACRGSVSSCSGYVYVGAPSLRVLW